MKTAMLLYTPFFASLLLDMMTLKIVKDFPLVPTAGTDGKTIYFDEDFLAKLSLPEAVFLCCHEVSHAMWMHLDRGRRYIDTGFEGQQFQPLVWNIAADFIINDLLKKCKVGTMPGKGAWCKDYDCDMLLEDVYRDMMKKIQPQSKGKGQSPPQGKETSDGQGGIAIEGGHGGHETLDTHIYKPGAVPEAEMKRAIQSAAAQAKAVGNMPAELEKFVNEILNPKVNWKERLRFLVTRAVARDETTWTTPHRRRLITQRIYYPSYTGVGCGTIVFATDTSGSMGQKEYDAAVAELADILNTCNPEGVWALSCDAEVHTAELLPSHHDIVNEPIKMQGGGGTDFRPVFQWVEDNGVEPVILIFFTDLMGGFPSEPPPYPVIWIATTDLNGPFGDTVKVELSEYEVA
jgi:predicted metal-dependent peptidase